MLEWLLKFYPEVAGVAMFLVSWLVHASQAHGVPVSQTTEDCLIMATAYLIMWAKRRWFSTPKVPNPAAHNDNKPQ